MPGPGLRAQFACPSGGLGWLVGHLMAFKSRERSLFVLSRLGLQPRPRVLAILALAAQPRSKGANEATARAAGQRLVEALRSRGFVDVQLEYRKLRPVSVALALGRKRDGQRS